MTSRILMPSRRTRSASGRRSADGSVSATAILDLNSQELRTLALLADAGDGQLAFLQRAHSLVAERVRPVYAMNDVQSTTETLRRSRGSCSQRMAVLEAAARSNGIATRVQGLLVDGTFWYERFPKFKWLVPASVVLAWPEFLVDRSWVSMTDLFGSACSTRATFANKTGQTLFEAVAVERIDWAGSRDGCDLSAYVQQDLGYFDSRDELFAEGQTLCPAARIVTDPLLSRYASV